MPSPKLKQPKPLPKDFKTLPEVFEKAGRHFKLVKRTGNVALYRISFSTTPDWSKPASAWEVVIIRQVLEGRQIKDYYMPPHEELPSEAQWGNRGFSPSTAERAEEIFIELVSKYVTNEDLTAQVAHAV